jgi:hypothetical protein
MFMATAIASQPGVCFSWWTPNSYDLSHTSLNRRVFLLQRTQTYRTQEAVASWREWPVHTFKANGIKVSDEYQLTRDET